MIACDITVRRGDFTLTVDLCVDAGITGVVGPSGVGKSTLLAAIAGLIPVTRGRIALGNVVFVDVAGDIRCPVHQRGIGMVFQDGLLFPHLSIAANLRYGERQQPSSQPALRYERVVDLLRLTPLLNRKPMTLSGGERQRVALGRALLSSPRALLLDEPLTAVDRQHRAEIIDELCVVREELHIPILYVSHDIGEVLRLTDDLVVLDAGRCVGRGDFASLVADPAVSALLVDPELTRRLSSQ